jgi:probable phosphoglycerate mutase
MTDLYLVRHGETAWSRTGRHTSFTDIELTAQGRAEATALAARLDPAQFGLVLCSPRVRAQATAHLAGFPDPVIDEDLAEWNYGQFEGKTPAEIRAQVPGWRIWNYHVPGGEQAADVTARLGRVVDKVRFSGVDKAICFSHGHALRVLALLWIGVGVEHGGAFPLGTASLSVLGYEKETSAILRWNS